MADQLEARVVLAGDKRQLAAVERGSALRVLEDIAKLPVAEVTDIRRQWQLLLGGIIIALIFGTGLGVRLEQKETYKESLARAENLAKAVADQAA